MISLVFLYFYLPITNIVLAKKILSKEYTAYNHFIMLTIYDRDVLNNIGFPINTNLQYSWTSQLGGRIIPNKIFITNETILNDDSLYLASLYNCTIVLGNSTHNSTFTNYYFYITYKNSFLISESGIAFAYKLKDEKFSIIHQLYRQGFIDELSFSFEPQPLEEKGYIHFGGVPDEFEKNSNGFHKASCDVDKNYHTWGCLLKSIHYNEKIFPFENYAFIFSCKSKVIIPSSFILFILNAIEKGAKCEIVNFSLKIENLQCPLEIVNTTKDISFAFSNFKLHFPLSVLFDCSYKNSCLSYFQTNGKKFENKIQIGYIFLKEFDIVNFNYEQSQISFYSKNYITEIGVNDKKHQMIKIFYSINGSALFCNTLIFLMIKLIFSVNFNDEIIFFKRNCRNIY